MEMHKGKTTLCLESGMTGEQARRGEGGTQEDVTGETAFEVELKDGVVRQAERGPGTEGGDGSVKGWLSVSHEGQTLDFGRSLMEDTSLLQPERVNQPIRSLHVCRLRLSGPSCSEISSIYVTMEGGEVIVRDVFVFLFYWFYFRLYASD